jgi:spore coat-associated protein S
MNKQILNGVLAQYDIKVLDVKNLFDKGKKAVWRIETPKGFKILKKVSNSEDTLKCTLSAISHLKKKGIHIPAVYRNKSGREYVKIEKVCYVLFEGIEGKCPDENIKGHLDVMVKEMAKFHKASEGFFKDKESKAKDHLGKWPEEYAVQIEDLKKFYNEVELQKRHGEIEKIFLKEFPYFYEKAEKSISALSGQEYKDWVSKMDKLGCLCHQDYVASNLILNNSGLFVLDTDAICIDLSARDIRKFLNKIMKKLGRWDSKLANEIIKAYQAENPLTSSQWKVVEFDLSFPHLFIGAMNKYFYKRDESWGVERYTSRIKEMCYFEKNKQL